MKRKEACMLSLNTKAFLIAFPLTVTAASILGVSQLRRHAGHSPQLSAVSENAPTLDGGNVTASALPSQPQQITIAARTEIEVQLDQCLATSRVSSGDPFFATVAAPVVLSGQTIIPKGAPVKGRVISVRASGRLKGVRNYVWRLNPWRSKGDITIFIAITSRTSVTIIRNATGNSSEAGPGVAHCWERSWAAAKAF